MAIRENETDVKPFPQVRVKFKKDFELSFPIHVKKGTCATRISPHQIELWRHDPDLDEWDNCIMFYQEQADDYYNGDLEAFINDYLEVLEHYEVEFPDFGKLDVEIPEGFDDISWHNDVCPSWTNEKQTLRIWIHPKKREDREWAEGDRFALALYEPEGEGDCWVKDLATSENWEDILEAVKIHNK